jgi:hypothetical protein
MPAHPTRPTKAMTLKMFTNVVFMAMSPVSREFQTARLGVNPIQPQDYQLDGYLFQ